VAAVGLGTQAVLAPALGWAIFCSSMAAIRSGMAHMPLPICALPRRPHSRPTSTLLLLVGLDPGAGLHVALAHHRAGVHGGVHLVAGAVQEAGVDEGHAAGGGGDAGLQVDAGAALLVHDAQLDGAVGQAQQLLDAAEQLAGKGHFGRAVHLGLDDVDASPCASCGCRWRRGLQVVQGDGGGDHGVQDAFGDLARCPASPHRMAGLVIRWPTLRTNISERPCSARPAAGRGVEAVGFRPRVKVLPPLADVSVSVPFRMPSQLL
jgi:hypothetical protein